MRPTFDYSIAMIPMLELMIDLEIFRYDDNKKYNLYNYEGNNLMSKCKYNGEGISVYASR